ncbi:MAG TPA: mycofactocin-coupled SDR family oxidoreductase [Kineosporiaceae bacterium]
MSSGTGRVVLVTGAARGIGAATARALARDGWAVVAVDRACDDPRLPYPMGSRDELDAVVTAIQDDGGQAVAVAADAVDAHAMAQAVGLARSRFGGLDAVVAAAGVIAGGVPLWQMPADQLAAVLEVNLMGAVVAARTAISAILARPQPRSGRFVAVASAAAHRGLPLLAAYCAAKAGVTGLVRGLATELRGSGVTANSVSPGSTDTPILTESARLYGLPTAQHFAAQQPIERLIHPGEVAAAISYLLSPQAAAVTGTDLPVDGGLSL